MTNAFWDTNYATGDYKYGTEPNAFIAGNIGLFKPGSTVLVPGDGEGRNSVWLARQGFTVVAQDGSSVGLKKARALAERYDVQVELILADLATWAPVPASVDAVVLTYVHLPPEIRRHAHRRLANALKPGGLLLLEAFHPLQLNHTSGGPKSEEMLYSRTMLRHDFADLIEEEWSVEVETVLDEGSGHQGKGHVVRFIGRRSACPYSV